MVELEVNNVKQDLSKVWVHFQSTPYPGGFNFSLEISNDSELMEELFKRFDLYSDNLSEMSENYFNPISFIIQFLKKRGDIKKEKTEWIVNKINEIYTYNDKLIIVGVMSNFIDDFEKTR